MSQISSIITKEQRFMVRLVLLVDTKVRPILHEILTFGMKDKDPHETLLEYIERVKGKLNASDLKLFKPYRQKITDDPSCRSFDVTLCSVAIRYACDGLASPWDDKVWGGSPDTLENHLKRLKDFRNSIMHAEISISEVKFYKTLEDLRSLIIDTLKLAKQKYSIDQTLYDNLLTDVNSGINQLRDCPLEDVDLSSHDQTSLFNALTDILENKGSADLEKDCELYSKVNPAFLIAGQDISIQVSLIYTALEIARRGRNKSTTIDNESDEDKIDHTNFLQFALKEKGGKTLKLILISGIAGSGKTTLIKKICCDWLTGRRTGNYTIDHLQTHKMIIPIECRSQSYDSLCSVISALMPTARKVFREERHMMHCLLDIPALYILDGLDELNSQSVNIFKDILEIKSRNATVICTTRPEKVDKFYDLVPNHASTTHFLLKGVPEEKREAFIEKYNEQLGATKEDIEGLRVYLRTTGVRLRDHWCLPLNLSLLTLLWKISPDRVNNITTSVELMTVFHELISKKLLQRICNPVDSTDQCVLEKKIDDFLALLYEEALLGIRDSTLLIPSDTIKRLTDFCLSNGLSSKEILAAFLIQKNSWTSTGLSPQVMFAHKSIQEFYAARYLYKEVFDRKHLNTMSMIESATAALKTTGASCVTAEQVAKLIQEIEGKCTTVKGVLSVIDKTVSDSKSMERYQNIMAMVLGLVYQSRMDVDKEVAVGLIELLQECGVKNQEDWIRILNTAYCNDDICKIIAEIPGLLKDISNIDDSTVFAYATLFRNIIPQKIKLNISGNPLNIPRLTELLNKIGEGGAFVERLYFEHLFKQDSPIYESPLTDAIDLIMQRCRVTRYQGPMPSSLPESELKWFHVCLYDDQSASRCLKCLHEKSKDIHGLSLVVAPGISIDSLAPLPGDIAKLNLFLPSIGSDNIEKGALVVKSLQQITGKKKFSKLYLPKCSLISGEIASFLNEVGRQGVQISYGVFLPSKCCPTDTKEVKELQEIARKSLQCSNGIRWGCEGKYEGRTYDMDTW